jgi:hypothetical protein
VLRITGPASVRTQYLGDFATALVRHDESVGG